MRKLINEEYNPTSGITTRYYSENGGKRVVIQRLQDIEPNLIQNRQELNEKSSKGGVGIASGLGTKVASIPMGLVEKLAAEGTNLITCTDAELKRILNDSNYSKLRTAHGRV